MTEKAEVVDLVPQPKTLRRTWNLMPGSLGEAMEIAAIIAKSEFAPRDYKGKPESVMLAIQMGADVGLSPMQALQNIAVINNRPSLWGDAALALVMPALERFHETYDGEPGTESYTAVCTAKRKGWPDETIRRFSIADARKAGLWGKAGPWTTYPNRMLQMRARGFTLRDVAADRLMGLILAEEAQDLPIIDVTPLAVETVAPAVSLMEALPEGVRDNIEKAFAALNMSPAQRLVKLNEYLGADNVVPEEAATALLEWCRDEFARRKTGQPRAKKDGDNAKRAGATGPAPSAGITPRDAPGGSVDGAVPDPSGNRVAGGAPAGNAPLTADEIFTPATQESELF